MLHFYDIYYICLQILWDYMVNSGIHTSLDAISLVQKNSGIDVKCHPGINIVFCLQKINKSLMHKSFMHKKV